MIIACEVDCQAFGQVCDHYTNPSDPQCVLQTCRQDKDCSKGFSCEKKEGSTLKHGVCML